MATLREAIEGRITDLTEQIQSIQTYARDEVLALQAEIDTEQRRRESFGPWLGTEINAVKTELSSLMARYGDQLEAKARIK